MLLKDKEKMISLLKEFFGNDNICVKIDEINLEEIPDHYKTWGISKYTCRGVDLSISFPCTGETNEEEKRIKSIFIGTQIKYLDE